MYTMLTDLEGLGLGKHFPPVFIFLSVPSLAVSTVSYILGVKILLMESLKSPEGLKDIDVLKKMWRKLKRFLESKTLLKKDKTKLKKPLTIRLLK